MALLGQLLERLADGERLVELLDRRLDAVRLDVGGLLALARGDPVEADPSGQLCDPGTERLRVPQRSEPAVDPDEDVLEGILGVGDLEPVTLGADREDVARVAPDEVVPRFLVACQAPRDQLLVTWHPRGRIRVRRPRRAPGRPSTARRRRPATR